MHSQQKGCDLLKDHSLQKLVRKIMFEVACPGTTTSSNRKAREEDVKTQREAGIGKGKGRETPGRSRETQRSSVPLPLPLPGFFLCDLCASFAGFAVKESPQN